MTSEEETEIKNACPDCGYENNSFACRIRHQNVLRANSEAKRHDKELRDKRQRQIYGI